jgi:hypothetical protein
MNNEYIIYKNQSNKLSYSFIIKTQSWQSKVLVHACSQFKLHMYQLGILHICDIQCILESNLFSLEKNFIFMAVY